MKAVCLILGAGLLIASLACITWTVVEVIRKDCGLGSARFWGAAAFHAVTATVACALLSELVVEFFAEVFRVGFDDSGFVFVFVDQVKLGGHDFFSVLWVDLVSDHQSTKLADNCQAVF